MELFCILLFYLTKFRTLLQSTDLAYIEYEASNIYTSTEFQTKFVYSVGEHYFHSFHYISA